MGGFDNHSNQVTANGHHDGTMPTRLGRLSAAMLAFQDDLELLAAIIGDCHDIFEFGRRATSKRSWGTDHGTAGSYLPDGDMVRGGVMGANPNPRPVKRKPQDAVCDFRSVYASVLTHCTAWIERMRVALVRI